MIPILHLFERGGWVIAAIIVLSTVLYARCVRLLIQQRRRNRLLPSWAANVQKDPVLAHQLTDELRAGFRQERRFLVAMVAAAPLLGLLGTVLGMERTFEGLSNQGASGSIESMANGIAEVLVTTESGLTVALPALLLMYIAHRQLQNQIQAINEVARTNHSLSQI